MLSDLTTFYGGRLGVFDMSIASSWEAPAGLRLVQASVQGVLRFVVKLFVCFIHNGFWVVYNTAQVRGSSGLSTLWGTYKLRVTCYMYLKMIDFGPGTDVDCFSALHCRETSRAALSRSTGTDKRRDPWCSGYGG